RQRSAVREMALPFQHFDRVPPGALPQAILLGHGSTDAVGAHHAREPGDRARQKAVLREQAEKGAEETAEGLLVEPSLEDGNDRLFRTKGDEAIGIEADV